MTGATTTVTIAHRLSIAYDRMTFGHQSSLMMKLHCWVWIGLNKHLQSFWSLSLEWTTASIFTVPLGLKFVFVAMCDDRKALNGYRCKGDRLSPSVLLVVADYNSLLMDFFLHCSAPPKMDALVSKSGCPVYWSSPHRANKALEKFSTGGKGFRTVNIKWQHPIFLPPLTEVAMAHSLLRLELSAYSLKLKRWSKIVVIFPWCDTP